MAYKVPVNALFIPNIPNYKDGKAVVLQSGASLLYRGFVGFQELRVIHVGNIAGVIAIYFQIRVWRARKYHIEVAGNAVLL